MKVNTGCPGAKKLKQPEPQEIRCPFCGHELEIWTDEARASCPACKKTVARKLAANCLDWCRYAKECFGYKEYQDYLRNKDYSPK